MSSANNARLVTSGKRHRGAATTELLPAHAPGIAPRGPLDPDVQGDRWCGHKWSFWHPLNDLALSALELGNGLYRIRGRTERLVYIGEGNVRDRLLTHAGKLRHDSPQGTALAAAAPLDYSVVLNRDWRPHQRLELETDLIAAHTIAFTAPPVGAVYRLTRARRSPNHTPGRPIDPLPCSARGGQELDRSIDLW
jgi:hypothetical protein